MDDIGGDSSARHVARLRDRTLMRTMSDSHQPSKENRAHLEAAEFTPCLSLGAVSPRSRQRSGPYFNLLAWASKYYWESAPPIETLSVSRESGHGLPWENKFLATNSRFAKGNFETGGHFGQRLRSSLQVTRIYVIKEVTANAREVNGPRRSHRRHPLRGEFCYIASGVRRTCGLRNKSSRLEIVHQSSCSTRGEVSCGREVRHSQLAIRGLREVHDHGVLARSQSNAPDQIGVEESWEHLKNSHLGTPKRIFALREWFIGGHFQDFNLLRQANEAPLNSESAISAKSES
jgi:hypothetical protein